MVHCLSEEGEELVCDNRINLELLALPEGGGDLALVLPQVHDLLLDHEGLGVAGQEVPELLDVLPGDVAHLGRGLGPVAQQALDGNLCPRPVLSE